MIRLFFIAALIVGLFSVGNSIHFARAQSGGCHKNTQGETVCPDQSNNAAANANSSANNGSTNNGTIGSATIGASDCGGSSSSGLSSGPSGSSDQSLLAPNKDKPTIILPNPICAFGGTSSIDNVFTFVVDKLLLLGGIVAFVFMLYGGFRYITSLGDPAAAGAAKKMIIGSVVGILIIAIAYVLVQFVIETVTGALK